MFNSKTRILIADDSSTMRSMIRRYLEEFGYDQLEEAKDGAETLAKLNAAVGTNTAFDCLLCDWNMPKVNGLEVLQKMRARPEFRKVAIIMVTSEAEREAVLQAIMSGLDGFILKPFEAEALVKAMESALKRRAGIAPG